MMQNLFMNELVSFVQASPKWRAKLVSPTMSVQRLLQQFYTELTGDFAQARSRAFGISQREFTFLAQKLQAISIDLIQQRLE
jgi:hypothetical protein